MNDCFTALGWTPARSKGGGGRDRRPLGLRTVDKERNMAGWKSWYVAKAAVWDRKRWSENMTALCAYWRNERRC